MFDAPTTQIGHGTTIRKAEPRELIGLRLKVLLPTGSPTTLAECGEDPLFTTFHVGIFSPGSSYYEGELPRTCASFALTTLRNLPNGPPAWKLYRMATDASLQRQGYGRALLLWAEERLTQRPRQRNRLLSQARVGMRQR
jgi:GNAT superfamily N-acetyltransferase